MKNSKNIIEILDNRYSAYLEDEGKWLNEGFKGIFTEKGEQKENLKTPVYLMLPKEIRVYVDQLLSDEGRLKSTM
ncbi:hypothetical protein OHD16_19955 [Sphingobacterium sp. ML3W]|uniref:hypothetical protein n=1 Tax=Sphingobacterium sp. ML3W TaxID=1538644 RepID=UPI00249A3F3F|nr:hypothetical protein [Sphingobacterium sp. ML3W]WFA82234.1 hypothetical protein OGI71_13095 [Sphingobacterium sp. ML3W]